MEALDGNAIAGQLFEQLGQEMTTATGSCAHCGATAVSGSLLAIGAILLLAGASIAPAYATIYAIAGSAAPAGTVTEAFAWLLTAASAGAAIGAAVAGALAQSAGAAAAFALAGVAGALAVLLALVRAPTLDPQLPLAARPLTALADPAGAA